MPVHVLDTTFDVSEADGVSSHRVVVRGAQPWQCAYPDAAHADGALGVTLDEADYQFPVPVRRLGKALVEASEAIAAGSRVVVSGTDGRINAASRPTAPTGTVGSNNAIRWTAREYSAAGNAIVIDIVVSGNSTAFSISVSGTTITINSATNAGGAATSTAAEVIAAINAHATAKLLVTAANESTSTGAAAVADQTAMLAGGGNSLNILGIAEEAARAPGDLIDVLLTP